MPKIKSLYSIEVKYQDRESNAIRLYRLRGITWGDLRIFRETIFTTGLFVAGIEGATFGDGFVIPPGDILKIYVYLQKQKQTEFTPEELR
jgi:hypothetical protein